ncbi:hypothetical protein M409DRAFT_54005 [Zasmidium cellare ATCC 36951]|uniref:Efflux pump dotC n=1 Tax=Zasmidium cellare ATCC 36951 TaxID=1080233 RepID=A0A6A6CLA1_ZASCE|nr:uncharacterized protein M409DRAFT_54005 [Zasmidium cellare ATCC 36951]KAF2167403.1 hypothetical protein M409DRAFT_54005 [Zasmidium cellare ATCC 36951]
MNPSSEEKQQQAGDRMSLSNHEDPEMGDEKPKDADSAPTKHTPDEDKPLDQKSAGLIAIIMTALCLAVLLSALDVTIITTALPSIAEHFHSSSGYTWIGASYLLSSAASTPLWGKLSDIFGRKPTLLLANAVFMVGSLIAALSVNVGMLITARAIQGVGGGGLLTLVDTIVGDLFSERARGAYLGLVGATWAVAAGLGPVVGGAFTQRVSWRWCFYINLPLDGVAFFIILFFLKIKTPRTPILKGLAAIDWLGTILVTGATLTFLFGLEYGGITFPWDSATVICLLVFGVVQAILFILVEWKLASYPVMPLRLFRTRSNSALLLAAFFHGLAFIGPLYFLPLFFQAVRGANPLLSGVYLLPTALAIGFSAIATGAYLGITGQYLPPIYLGWAIMTLGFGLLIDLTSTSGWAKLILYQIIAGVGIGPYFQAPLVALQANVSLGDIATATATLNFIRSLATSIGVVLGQVVYSNQLDKKHTSLTSSLGPAIAAQLTGGNADANVQVIDRLPEPQRRVARMAFADAMTDMWIMYTVFAGVGLVLCGFLGRKTLSSEWVERETGLEAERRFREEERAREEVRRRGKVGGDV